MVHSRDLVLFILFLPGAARRSIRIGDSAHDSQQQTNTLTNTLEVSADARETFLPGGFGNVPGLQLHAAPWGRLSRFPKTIAMDTAVKVDFEAPWAVEPSVTQYDSAPVPANVVQSAVRAATLSPSKVPWRFYEVGPETRAKLVALNPEFFAGATGWMVVTVAVTENDTHGSVSAKTGQVEDSLAWAVKDFMASLRNQGLVSKWMTGVLSVDQSAVMDVIGADQDSERFMGIVSYGYLRKDSKLKESERWIGLGMHKVLP